MTIRELYSMAESLDALDDEILLTSDFSPVRAAGWYYAGIVALHPREEVSIDVYRYPPRGLTGDCS